MSDLPDSAADPAEIVPLDDLRATWLIARRGAVESLRDYMTMGISAFSALVIPLVVVLELVRPQTSQIGAQAGDVLGSIMAVYLLVVGLIPSSGSIGIASGLFAGEREQGNLLPLLATPASNRAIFAGKVLGAVIPAVLFAGVAVASYLADIWLLLGSSTLRLLPIPLSCAMLALVPAEALLGAAVASLVSSRVRTFQSAQMLSSLALYPIMGALFGLVVKMQDWGWLALVVGVAAMLALDLLIVLISAATWQREEVLARR